MPYSYAGIKENYATPQELQEGNYDARIDTLEVNSGVQTVVIKDITDLIPGPVPGGLELVFTQDVIREGVTSVSYECEIKMKGQINMLRFIGLGAAAAPLDIHFYYQGEPIYPTIRYTLATGTPGVTVTQVTPGIVSDIAVTITTDTGVGPTLGEVAQAITYFINDTAPVCLYRITAGTEADILDDTTDITLPDGGYKGQNSMEGGVQVCRCIIESNPGVFVGGTPVGTDSRTAQAQYWITGDNDGEDVPWHGSITPSELMDSRNDYTTLGWSNTIDTCGTCTGWCFAGQHVGAGEYFVQSGQKAFGYRYHIQPDGTFARDPNGNQYIDSYLPSIFHYAHEVRLRFDPGSWGDWTNITDMKYFDGAPADGAFVFNDLSLYRIDTKYVIQSM